MTSVDREGTRKGFDTELIRTISGNVSVPVIASGGMGTPEDMIPAVRDGGADAIAMADILHYGRASFAELRKVAKVAGLTVRDYA